MTDAREALVERIVALYAGKYQITDAWLASSAIDLVLEEAAKVAENPPKVWVRNTYQWQMPKHPWLPNEIAAAIRALKSGT